MSSELYFKALQLKQNFILADTFLIEYNSYKQGYDNPNPVGTQTYKPLGDILYGELGGVYHVMFKAGVWAGALGIVIAMILYAWYLGNARERLKMRDKVAQILIWFFVFVGVTGIVMAVSALGLDRN